MRKKNKKKRTNGSDILLVLLCLALPAAGGHKKNQAEPYAVIAGTVFRDPGFALPGAEVTLTPDSSSDVKIKKMKAISNTRGEFGFHVPAISMRYTLKASAKGFHPEEKPVAIQSDERIDVTFSLASESK